MNSVIMRPTFYLSQKEVIGLNTGTLTKVNGEGVYELEPVPGQDYYIEADSINIFKYSDINLIWNIPQMKSGIEFEMNRKHISFIMGLNYAKSTGQTKKFLGGNIGLSYFDYYQWWAWRFDVNAHFNHVNYRVEYLETYEYESEEIHIYLYNEENDATYWNMSFGIMLNSKVSSWPVNLFAGVNGGN